MARTEIVVDDLDGSTPAEERDFTLEGRTYKLDLCDDNADELSAAIVTVTKYLAVARKVRQRKTTQASPKAAGEPPNHMP